MENINALLQTGGGRRTLWLRRRLERVAFSPGVYRSSLTSAAVRKASALDEEAQGHRGPSGRSCGSRGLWEAVARREAADGPPGR